MLQSGIYFPKASGFSPALFFVHPMLRFYHAVPLPKETSAIKELAPSVETSLRKYYRLAVPYELM